MDAGAEIRTARQRAGLSQRGLADRAGTSQATISAYELGRKRPSIATFERLLAAAGARLDVVPARPRVASPTRRERERVARELIEVIALAEALPTRHERRLRFPRLPVGS